MKSHFQESMGLKPMGVTFYLCFDRLLGSSFINKESYHN